MKGKLWKKLLTTAMVTAALSLTAVIGASACTTIYVGGNLVEEGTPFVARTEDYGSDMNKLWQIMEAGTYKKGDRYVGCPGYGAFEWTFTHDNYRFTYFTNDIYYESCPECGDTTQSHPSYSEFGTNEKGVSVSATETLYGRPEVTDKVDPMRQEKVDGKVGIEETDIPTIILSEAASAREGVELLMNIYDEYGAYFASGIFICDKDEIWYIENCSGTQYVAIKLHDDLMFLEPNMAVIGEVDLDDTENVIASDRLIEVAKEAGTFVGNEAENIINFRASYSGKTDRMDARMVEGLNFLNKNYNYTAEELTADNSKFTISNVKDGKIVPLYTNIEADRQLNKDDVFNYYKLSTIGKPSNQEIEIFQIYKDRPVETATVGWVGVGNMSNNVFVPYYPMLLTDQYEGYQVSTAVVTQSDTKPDTFCTWTTKNDGKYVVYPENWRDSYYFTFEGLGGYIQYAEQITGQPISEADKQYVLNELKTLQNDIYKTFDAMDPKDTTEVGKQMAKQAHEKGLELIDYLLAKAPKETFKDVATNSWYYNAVSYVNEKGLITGTGNGQFSPDAKLTRAMMAQILYSMAGKPDMSNENLGYPYADVAGDSWCANAVYWARLKGIVSGVSAEQFAPNNSITREQLALMLYNYAGKPAVSNQTLTFADKDKVSDYAQTAIGWAVENGILSGKTGNMLDPQGTATRAEAAQMIMKFSTLAEK